jgi:hypothetical protein
MSELKATLTPSNTLIGTLSLGADYYKGETGDSGVYLGEVEPVEEEKYIWIEPEAKQTMLATEEQVAEAKADVIAEVESKGYQTKE